MKKKSIISLIIILLIIIVIIFLFIVNNFIDFKLIGDKKIVLEVHNKYIDKGVNVKLFNKSLEKYIKVENNVNENKLGDYKIIYSLELLGINDNIIRTVNVVDRTKPEIKLKGIETITLYVGDNYKELGVIAIDNYDGNISDKIEIENNININKAGNYYVTYKIEDSSKNENTIKRKVIVKENYKPIINNELSNNPIYRYIKDNGHDISVGYYNLVNGKSYFYNENKVYFAASLIKTVETLYLYDNNMVNEETLPYIKKAITVSDNPAHHYLQNLIGQNNLKKYGNGLGAKYTLSGGGVCGNTTVNDQLVFLKRLYEITKNSNEELKSFFINDYENYIKFDNNIPVMHKYGLYNQVFHDVGIVLDEEPYIVIILTGRPNNYEKVVNELSKIIYEYHKDN